MARLTDESLFKGMSGKLGPFVIKQYKDKTVVTALPSKPNRKRKKPGIRLTNSCFDEAVKYARSIVHNPRKKAAYAKTLPEGTRVYNAAIKEYMATHWIRGANGITYLGPDGKPKQV